MQFSLSRVLELNFFAALLACVYSLPDSGILGVVAFVHAAVLVVPFVIGVYGIATGRAQGTQLSVRHKRTVDFAVRIATYSAGCVAIFWGLMACVVIYFVIFSVWVAL